MTSKLFCRLLVISSIVFIQDIYPQTKEGILLPTEEEVGRVFLASLLVEYATKPPGAILVYPKLVPTREGKINILGTTAAMFYGKSASEFVDCLTRPSKIASADVACDYVFFSSERGETRRCISGEMLLYKGDAVRVRLHTDSPIYPKIDFYYEGAGFKKWIMEHSTKLKTEK